MKTRILAALLIALVLPLTGCDSSSQTADAAVVDAFVGNPEMGVGGAGGGGVGGSGGSVASGQHLRLSYLRRVSPRDGSAATTTLVVYDFVDDEENDLTANLEIDCASRLCMLHKDMTWIGWLERDADRFSLVVAPVDPVALVVDFDRKRVVADEVRDFDFTGDLVVYSTGNDTLRIQAEPIAGPSDDCPNPENPAICRQAVGETNQDGGFRVTDLQSIVIVVQTTLSSMTLLFYNVKNGLSQTLHTFGEQGGTGSEFSGNLPVGLSPDASYLAVFTRNGFTWRVQTLLAVPDPPQPASLELFETETNQNGDCGREMPFNFNDVRFDPRFSADSRYIYFLAHGDCQKRAAENRTNRDDYDILRIDRELAEPVVNVTNNVRANSWINHDIGDFSLRADGSLIAFTASRPNDAQSRSIWIIDPDTGEYLCDRGNPIPGPDGQARCEFISLDLGAAAVEHRAVRFHEIDVP